MEEDFELTLFDRLNAIRDYNKKIDLENNAYLSFSGGKDSTVLHYLIDMALPNNKIPRLYINTGIEYLDILGFVNSLKQNDDRINIVKPSKPIKQTLEKYGYPFKSKQHSHMLSIASNNKEEIQKEIKKIENDKSLLGNYDYIHNLPRGIKSTIKYIYGVRERERELYLYGSLP